MSTSTLNQELRLDGPLACFNASTAYLGVGLSLVGATTAAVGGFSLLAVLVLEGDEHPTFEAGAQTLQGGAVGLYVGVIVVVGRTLVVSTVTNPFCGPGPGKLPPSAGPYFIRHPSPTTYVDLCQLMLYNIRVEFPIVEVDVDKLQVLRINRGLSQRRLAELAGVSNTSVWKIEQGGGANPATLKKLADVLGVLPTDLLKKGR